MSAYKDNTIRARSSRQLLGLKIILNHLLFFALSIVISPSDDVIRGHILRSYESTSSEFRRTVRTVVNVKQNFNGSLIGSKLARYQTTMAHDTNVLKFL